MRSIITKFEEKKFYKRIYTLSPVYIGLLFSILIYLLYNLIGVALFKGSFTFNWLYILIAFAFGVIEASTTIYFTFKLIDKRYKYLSKKNKVSKTDAYLSVILNDGYKKTKGVLLFTKDTIEFKIYDLFDDKTIFNYLRSDATLNFVSEKYKLINMILHLSKNSYKLKLKIRNNEYLFTIPCLVDVSHRI